MRQWHWSQDTEKKLPCFSKLLPQFIWEFIFSIRLCGKLLRDLSSLTAINHVQTYGEHNVLRVKSCTRSLSSARSSLVGGTNPFGCLDDAARLGTNTWALGRDRPTCRNAFVRARETNGEDIVTLLLLHERKTACVLLLSYHWFSQLSATFRLASARNPRSLNWIVLQVDIFKLKLDWCKQSLKLNWLSFFDLLI